MADPIGTTHWSIVRDAAGSSASARERAFAELCQDYWYPLYAFARRRVSQPDKAQELTQEFFARLLEKNYLAKADPQLGKFRAFLITAFKNFMANESKRERAQKRGGNTSIVSLDFEVGEKRLSHEPIEQWTPEKLYDQQWAVTLVNRVLAELRSRMAEQDKERLFDELKGFLAGPEQSTRYSATAERLGLTEGAVRAAVHRLRGRYRDLIRKEISHTVSSAEEIDEEIRDLFDALGDA